MSSQIDIFVVDEVAFKTALASRDIHIFRKIADEPGAEGPEFNGQMSKLDWCLFLLGQPPARRALKKILLGRIGHRPDARFYVSAYHFLCEHYAVKWFQDWNPVSRAARWIGDIADALKRKELDVDLLKLVFGPDILIDIPHVDPDYDINMGLWSSDEIAVYKSEIERYFASDYFESKDDPFRELGYPLHDIHKWLTCAAGGDNNTLVGFYY